MKAFRDTSSGRAAASVKPKRTRPKILNSLQVQRVKPAVPLSGACSPAAGKATYRGTGSVEQALHPVVIALLKIAPSSLAPVNRH